MIPQGGTLGCKPGPRGCPDVQIGYQCSPEAALELGDTRRIGPHEIQGGYPGVKKVILKISKKHGHGRPRFATGQPVPCRVAVAYNQHASCQGFIRGIPENMQLAKTVPDQVFRQLLQTAAGQRHAGSVSGIACLNPLNRFRNACSHSGR